MAASIDIMVDDFGRVDVGEVAQTPFTVRNSGTTRFEDIVITTTFPDAVIMASVPRMLLVGAAFTGTVIWSPPFEQEEGRKQGDIIIKAYSIGA